MEYGLKYSDLLLPGWWKSQAIEQVCDELDWTYVDIALALTSS